MAGKAGLVAFQEDLQMHRVIHFREIIIPMGDTGRRHHGKNMGTLTLDGREEIKCNYLINCGSCICFVKLMGGVLDPADERGRDIYIYIYIYIYVYNQISFRW